MISLVPKHEYVQLNFATCNWFKAVNNAPVFVTHGASCGHGLHIAAIEHAVPTNMSALQARISTLPTNVLSAFEKIMIGTMNMRPVALAAYVPKTSRSMADVLLRGRAARMMAWMEA